MRNIILGAVAFVDLLSNVPYIKHAYSGRTKPNLATWSTWVLLNIITVVAAVAAKDALNTVVLALTFLAGSLTILLIAIFRGTRKYTLFDGVCQSAAIIGVILWQLSNNPNVAIIFVILIDLFAILPTFRHAYLYPFEETWITFFVSSLASLVFALLATKVSIAALALPLESMIVGWLLVVTILVGQRRETRNHAK